MASVIDNGVFVCGSPYSESTLVAWAIAQHPRFFTGPESRFLFKLFGGGDGLEVPFLYKIFNESREGGGWLDSQGVGYAEFLRYLGKGVCELFSSRSNGRRWIDNSPENALFVDELLYLFPSATVVGVRESAENALLVGLGPVWGETSEARITEVTDVWRHYQDCLERAAIADPGRVLVLDQDDLLENPVGALSDCLEFLGEESVPDVSAFFETTELRTANSVGEARRELNRVRNSERAMAIISRLVASPTN